MGFTEDDPFFGKKTEKNPPSTGNSTFMLLKNANDDNTYNFGIKMIWRAVAVSFSEAHPFVFACFVCKIQYLFFSSNVPA